MLFTVSLADDARAHESFIGRADAGLYAAKRAGRNRVISETDPEVAEADMAAA